MKCPRCNEKLSRAEVARLLGSAPKPSQRKLTDAERRHVRQRKMSAQAYADRYGVSESLIFKIWQGKR